RRSALRSLRREHAAPDRGAGHAASPAAWPPVKGRGQQEARQALQMQGLHPGGGLRQSDPAGRGGRGPPSGPVRPLGWSDGLLLDQGDRGLTRERFHHGRQDRAGLRRYGRRAISRNSLGVAAAGSVAPRIAEITAMPAAPAARTGATCAGPIPPMAITGARTAATAWANASTPRAGASGCDAV